ncbi:MAG: hypothetical protein WAK43_11115, partial [Dehalococcoidales bacterium]
AIPFVYQPHNTDSDNSNYRLHDLQSDKKEQSRRAGFTLVPGNLRYLDTVGHHIEPRYFCILFSVHHTRDLHRHHDRNY